MVASLSYWTQGSAYFFILYVRLRAQSRPTLDIAGPPNGHQRMHENCAAAALYAIVRCVIEEIGGGG